jgi:hypothetical protein
MMRDGSKKLRWALRGGVLRHGRRWLARKQHEAFNFLKVFADFFKKVSEVKG